MNRFIILITISVVTVIAISSVFVLQLANNSNEEFMQQTSSNFEDEEEYFYIQDYKLEKLPTFCAQDFTDINISDANEILMSKTQQSIQTWQDKIVQYTGNPEWSFEFKIISSNKMESTKIDCDATFIFEPTPPSGQEETRGETFPSSEFSEVVIFYLDPTNNTKEQRIDPDINFIITHEIGHVLGLDHPIFDDGPFVINEDGIPVARSIMISPENYYNLPDEMTYEITDYDVRSIVNLYRSGILFR